MALFNRFNYETYGGVPVLGVTAPVLIGHGVSTPLAIKNMILQGEQVVRHGLIEKYKKAMLEQYIGEIPMVFLHTLVFRTLRQTMGRCSL